MKCRNARGLLIAIGLVGVFVAGAVTMSGRPQVARATDGDVVLLAGATLPYGQPNPVGPVAGDQVWFSVYAETIEEHDGFLYIRDIEGIHKVDTVTGSTQRIAGVGYGTAGVTPGDGVAAVDAAINWGRTLAVGPDGAVYFMSYVAVGGGQRLYRVDADTGLLSVVAGDGSNVSSGDGGPAVNAGLAVEYLGLKDSLFVDSSNSIWFVDGPESGPNSIRRIDGVTGVISTVYEYLQYPPSGSELLGFTPDGAAYIYESTYEPDYPYDLISSRTIRVDAAGAQQEVGARRTTCDDAIAGYTGQVEDYRRWADNGVLRTVTYDDFLYGSPTTPPGHVGVVTLCTLDLASGAATERALSGTITDFLGDAGYITILANALTSRADGVSFFVNREDDGTYKVYRWDDAPSPEPSFVTRSGAQLLLDGQPFRFTGMNLYDANNTGLCGGTYGTGNALADAIDAMGTPQVMRSWFFQPLATSGGVRDWTAFDHTLAVAQAKGVRIVATLGNQWQDCDGLNGAAGKYKDDAWYAGGYNTDIDAGMIVSYRAWVAEVVARYRDNPTIMAWEILNEPEVKTERYAPLCAPNAAMLLNDFTADISSLIKATDPNHLVSLGTIGGGQCGSDNENFSTLHANAGIDLCSVHDYRFPNDPIAGDQWNGVAKRLDQCRVLNKPIFVGEAGLQLPETAGSTVVRAEKLTAKMSAAFRAGVVGYLLWGWADPPRVGVTLDDDIHDIGLGDPLLATLAVAPSSWPDDGGDSDNDGVSNAVDSGTGWDDHAGTTGSITNPNGLTAVVLDAPSPAGVTIFVPSVGLPVRAMTVSACGVAVEVDSGTWATLTCGSITANVATGQIRVRVSNDTLVTIPGATSATVSLAAGGVFTVSDVAGAGVSVTVEGTTTELAAGAAPRSFASWTFVGFSPPVSNTAVNTVVAGKKVTLAWILLDAAHRPVKTLQQVTLRVVTIEQCPGGRVVPDGAPITLTLNNGLRYLGFGIYVVEWATPKAYKDSCKEMRLDLGEGVTRNAKFRFK